MTPLLFIKAFCIAQIGMRLALSKLLAMELRIVSQHSLQNDMTWNLRRILRRITLYCIMVHHKCSALSLPLSWTISSTSWKRKCLMEWVGDRKMSWKVKIATICDFWTPIVKLIHSNNHNIMKAKTYCHRSTRGHENVGKPKKKKFFTVVMEDILRWNNSMRYQDLNTVSKWKLFTITQRPAWFSQEWRRRQDLCSFPVLSPILLQMWRPEIQSLMLSLQLLCSVPV